MKEIKSRIVTIKIEQTLWDKVKKAAVNSNRSWSGMVREVLNKNLQMEDCIVTKGSEFEIGDIISLMRKKEGISQSQLAKHIKISSKHLSEIENGKKKPRWELLMSITNALGLKLIIKNDQVNFNCKNEVWFTF